MGMSQPVQERAPRVDAHLGKFAQGCTVLLTVLAFVLLQPIFTLITAIVMAISALVPKASPYRLLYQRVVVPLGLLKPRIVGDDPSPHRFAQGVGAIFLFASSAVLFFTHIPVLGWTDSRRTNNNRGGTAGPEEAPCASITICCGRSSTRGTGNTNGPSWPI